MDQIIAVRKASFLKSLDFLNSLSDVESLRRATRKLLRRIRQKKDDKRRSDSTAALAVSKPFLTGELEQIAKAESTERACYYVTRLRKALLSAKPDGINDVNLRRWKEYDDILTDSLWLLPRRDNSGEHSAWYWGNFIPQIPHQLMVRYTKKGEWVLDPFAGSGTTLLECQQLGRNGFGIELNPAVARRAKSALRTGKADYDSTVEIEVGDSVKLDFRKLLRRHGADSVQLVILHPPYHDIIRFSRRQNDLSNARSVRDFVELFGKVVDNSVAVLDQRRYLAVVIGDKYNKREWTPLGFMIMSEVLKRNFMLKSIVVKNFDQTTGKRKQAALWRYRALAGGFYLFKHEYIFIFQKK